MNHNIYNMLVRFSQCIADNFFPLILAKISFIFIETNSKAFSKVLKMCILNYLTYLTGDSMQGAE